jgi:predicted ATP-grasp superfamily ATP-dependent carboligase
MGASLGATVDLDKVPLKYEGLSATEVWISEAQERMVLAVAPGDWERSWREVLLWADVVWLTAPEAEGDLLRLSREVEAAGCALLGPSSEAVAVAGSSR